MFSLFIFMLTFKILATIISAVYCVKIAKLEMTQTYTWILFAFGFGLRSITQIQSMVYADSILGLYRHFHLSIVLSTQFLEFVIVSLFLVGVVRSYYGVVNAKLTLKK